MSFRRMARLLLLLTISACEPAPDSVVGPLTVSDAVLPTAIKGAAYRASLSSAVSGGTDHSWRMSGGALPPGLTLSSTGSVSGTPTENGTFDFSAVQTAGSAAQTARFTLSVIDALVVTNSMEPTFIGLRDNLWRCEFTWTLAAIGGRPEDRAYWKPSEINWVRAADGGMLTTQVSERDLTSWFGEDQIWFGAKLSIPFYLASDGPFKATVQVRYQVTPTFAMSTASSSIDCL